METKKIQQKKKSNLRLGKWSYTRRVHAPTLMQGCSLFSEKTAKFWIYVPVFFLFLGGVFCPFSGFPSSTLTVVGSFRENGQVLD